MKSKIINSIKTGFFITLCLYAAPSLSESGAAPLLLNDELGQNYQSEHKDPESQNVDNGDAIRTKLSEYGKIIFEGTSNIDGVKKWIVNTNGSDKTLYSAGNFPVVFTGDGFDIYSGKSLKEENDFKTTATETKVKNFAFSKDYTGPIPDGLKILENMPAYTEGDGVPQKTLYIFFDPQCPWCHKAYSNTRQYVKKGYSIKWLPVDIVGGDGSRALAALLLAASDPVKLKALGYNFDKGNVFNNIMTARTPERRAELISAANKIIQEANGKVDFDKVSSDIANNDKFIIDQLNAHPEIDKKGVPAAFIFDSRIDKAKLVMGISEDVVLKDIYGE
ncbi:thioredoxin domain-containing protein [Citrobacter freundii]|uniref:hypothetical protein n=1 Tax=Citrobacter freundii TaxID=546 RepID=UPI0019088746|nr:hypothetical protein [Citrobacter freundii]MBJ8931586.1 hypothetical protein [Citrobacter freundii]